MLTTARSALAAAIVLAMLAGCEQKSASNGSGGSTQTNGGGGSAPATAPAADPVSGSPAGERSQTAPTTGNPNGSTFTLRPQSLAGKDSLGGIAEAVKAFQINMERFPTTAEGLEVLVSPDRLENGKDKWQGPYITSMEELKDTYRNMIEYESTGTGFVLRSLGSDGQRGGSGSGADIELRF